MAAFAKLLLYAVAVTKLRKMTDKEQIEILKQKLRVAEEALNDIVRFDDELEDEWGDPGERANAALEKMMIIDGF